MRRLIGILVVTVMLATAAPALAAQFVIKHFGCHDAETYQRISRIINQGDKAAAIRALTAEVYLRRCVLFEEGETVYTGSISGWKGLIQVRKVGEPAEFWTGLKMVR